MTIAAVTFTKPKHWINVAESSDNLQKCFFMNSPILTFLAEATSL